MFFEEQVAAPHDPRAVGEADEPPVPATVEGDAERDGNRVGTGDDPEREHDLRKGRLGVVLRRHEADRSGFGCLEAAADRGELLFLAFFGVFLPLGRGGFVLFPTAVAGLEYTGCDHHRIAQFDRLAGPGGDEVVLDLDRRRSRLDVDLEALPVLADRRGVEEPDRRRQHGEDHDRHEEQRSRLVRRVMVIVGGRHWRRSARCASVRLIVRGRRASSPDPLPCAPSAP